MECDRLYKRFFRQTGRIANLLISGSQCKVKEILQLFICKRCPRESRSTIHTDNATTKTLLATY